MTVYVDELRVYPNAWGPFLGGSCHLTANTLDELHAFATKIGMRRAWFQNHLSAPHYDLTAQRRLAALQAGAVFKSAREQAQDRKRACAWEEFKKHALRGQAPISDAEMQAIEAEWKTSKR